MATGRHHARSAGRDLRSVGRASAAARAIRTWRSTTSSASSAPPAIRCRSARCSSAIARRCRFCLQIFATSQHLSDLLITDTESYDLLRMTEGQPVARDALVEELAAEVDGPGRRRAGGHGGVAPLQAARDAADFLRRHHSRPAAGHGDAADFIPGRRHGRSGRASPRADWPKSAARRAAPDGRRARFVVLAHGQAGRRRTELLQRHRPDLSVRRRRQDRLVPRSKPTANSSTGWCAKSCDCSPKRPSLGVAYRVDLRLRPAGRRGPMVHSLEAATALLRRARAAPGNARRSSRPGPWPAICDLGREFLEQLEPWIYRRYLSLADITGIKALKRRIEQRTLAKATTPQRQDGPRRHSRHRVRDPVPAIAQRRRPAAPAHRQHAGSDRAAGELRLPDASGALAAGRELQLSPQDRASFADHVRSANAHAARPSRTKCASLAIRMGYADHAGRNGARPPSRTTTRTRPS